VPKVRVGRPRAERNSVHVDAQKSKEIANFLAWMGQQLFKSGDSGISGECYKYALELDPTMHHAAFNLATLYDLSGNFEASYRCFNEAVKLRPQHPGTRAMLAQVATKLGKMTEAKSLLDRLIVEAPADVAVLQASAIWYFHMGDLELARDYNDKSLVQQPHNLAMLLNKALINMSFGEWSSWWWLYERCLSYGRNDRMRHLRMEDAWSGQPREGKSLVIISDQGNGDAIQFGRYIPEAKALGKFDKVTYVVQPDLKVLMTRSGVADEVLGFGEVPNVDRDEFSSLLGIMRILNIDPENCRREPHIIPSQRLTEEWHHRIAATQDFRQNRRGRKPRVALVWGGDPRHGNDHNRSMDLKDLAPLGHLTDHVDFFSFQVGNRRDQVGTVPGLGDVVDLGDQLRDFDDTAAALRHMDALVSVDTSIVHLAGCMGIRTFLMLPLNGEWRWPRHGDAPDWYNGVRIARQPTFRSWAPVIREAVDYVRGLVNNG
jgi:hypothetical protein